MNGGPKDNANPVVKAVDKRTARAKKRQPIGWEELQRISADPLTTISLDDPSTWTAVHFHRTTIQRSAEDILIMRALADVSALTGGQGISLLTRAGIVVASPEELSFEPTFSTPIEQSPVVSEPEPNDQLRDTLDSDEVFDIIRNIQDPEHPLTLEQLGVVSREQVTVQDVLDLPPEERKGKMMVSSLSVRFTPTVPHCSMATLIGLAIQVKLHRSLPRRFKVKVAIEPGSHQSESAVNKQLQDKERVRAALENPHLLKIVNKCIADGMNASC